MNPHNVITKHILEYSFYRYFHMKKIFFYLFIQIILGGINLI